MLNTALPPATPRLSVFKRGWRGGGGAGGVCMGLGWEVCIWSVCVCVCVCVCVRACVRACVPA